MLKELKIENLAIIEKVDLEFKNGLIVLTGETGAGKSIILSGINLLIGEKASADMVRDGEEYLLAQGVFAVNEEQEAELKELGIEAEDNEVIVRRHIDKNGKGKAFVNNIRVPMSSLKEIMGTLVDIVGQHSHQMLLNKSNHLRLLDRFLGDDGIAIKKQLEVIYNEYSSLERRIQDVEKNKRETLEKKEFYEFQLQEIDKVNLKDGEDEKLEEEYKKLFHGYAVDGFVLLGEGVWMELLARDEILQDTKLICPGFDIKGMYGGKAPERRCLGEYHGGFQNTMRRFLKGDEDQIPGFLYYNKENTATHGVIHYMANHDGFTLADLVSYDYRHNEENGEENRDGCTNNYSWNCGIEGETRKIKVQKLRERQMKNAILLLMLSQGTPLLYGGDELGNSQNGNNNPYCQDNEIGWVDWSRSRKFSGFTRFVQDVIRFRREHPILHMRRELRVTDYRSLGWPELSYHSERAWFSNTESSSRQAGILYCGAYVQDEEKPGDDFIYVMYNMHWNDYTFALPDLPEKSNWYLAVDSGKKAEEAVSPKGAEEKIEERKFLTVKGRTIVVLIGK